MITRSRLLARHGLHEKELGCETTDVSTRTGSRTKMPNVLARRLDRSSRTGVSFRSHLRPVYSAPGSAICIPRHAAGSWDLGVGDDCCTCVRECVCVCAKRETEDPYNSMATLIFISGTLLGQKTGYVAHGPTFCCIHPE